ncbi:hypothetical protein [Pandoraea oxalativorans]|nr:hypothetical protein [Pandoraea oxalativorans]
MTEKQTSGELLVNGDFATGDFTGWSLWDGVYMSVVPNEGGHVAVLKPVPYNIGQWLGQLVVRDRSDGDYAVGFWLRTSDAYGNPVPGVTRKVTSVMSIHPYDDLGIGYTFHFPSVATSSWRKYTWKFSVKGRLNQGFSFSFLNERKRPDGSLALPEGTQGYEMVMVPNEGQEPETLNEPDDDNCSVAIRNATIFKA